ncbi:MAG: selenocysteine-specific translation elongation factor [Halomonas sp.]|uniref:selenocysteine-specific translation elongation factor n=1 Tax=Halomonas sp. TaxID=1486246 RepID=UPI003F8FB5A1
MIVATAGHIDHGKTALLEALTGHVGDQRREERERGITIDLGYRYAELGDGATLGFIDVPGHERFVHNMLAGAGGVDLALLVVAADDGVMPQTREHLAILALLRIPRLWVVLTKCDRVDAERRSESEAEIMALLADGPFHEAPCFTVSSVTGQGIASLRESLEDAARGVAQRADAGHFRLSVDRAFSVTGAGVVVTGTAIAGRVAVGDSLWLVDSNDARQRVRVRGLHAQNRAAETATAGQRVALNLVGERLRADQVERGSWLLPEALLGGSRRLDIRLSLLGDAARALEHWTPVHVHLGAQHLTGRVALLEDSRVAPGESTLAQLVLNGHAHAVHGDALVLRDQSAWHTLGGGVVLDPLAPSRQRRTPTRLAQLHALDAATLEQALPTLLEGTDNGLAPERLARQFNRQQDSWQLPQAAISVDTARGARLLDAARWEVLGATLIEVLGRFHDEQPDEPGPDRSRLRRYGIAQGLPALEPVVFTALVEAARADSRLVSSGPWLHLPDHRVRLSEAEEALKAQLVVHLHNGGIDPPWVRDLARLENRNEAEVRGLLRKLARMGELHQVVRDLFYPESSVDKLADTAIQLADADGTLSVIDFRDALGLGRKRCVQLLEYLDRIGVTRRFGNQRRVREESDVVVRVRTG